MITIEGVEFVDTVLGHGKAPSLFIEMMRGFPQEWVWGDPFLGAGATTLAAAALGRSIYAMELEPETLAVALESLAVAGLEAHVVATS